MILSCERSLKTFRGRTARKLIFMSHAMTSWIRSIANAPKSVSKLIRPTDQTSRHFANIHEDAFTVVWFVNFAGRPRRRCPTLERHRHLTQKPAILEKDRGFPVLWHTLNNQYIGLSVFWLWSVLKCLRKGLYKMMKNGHHVISAPSAAAACSPEKRRRTVRVWCDGWWVRTAKHLTALA